MKNQSFSTALIFFVFLSLLQTSLSMLWGQEDSVIISDNEVRLPKHEADLIGVFSVSGDVPGVYTYQLAEGVNDDSLFAVRNDSLFVATDLGLDAQKEFTIDVLAISNDDDSVQTVITLTSVFRVEAVFTGPMGFTLTSSDKKVLVDVLSGPSPCYSFITNTDTIRARMTGGLEPFGDADIIYTSHSHCCHFNADLLSQAINNNPQAIAIMNSDVRTAMDSYFTNHPELLDRVYVPDLDIEEFIDTVVAGIEMRLTKITHDGSSTLCLNLMLDSIRFSTFDDYNDLSPEDYETIGFAQLPTDVAFLGSLMLSQQDILTSIYEPSRLLTFSHINTPSTYNTLLSQAETLNGLGYQTDVLIWPMEMFSYTKKNNELIVNKFNNAPELNHSFEQADAIINTEVHVQVPADAFLDADASDELTYSFLVSGQPLEVLSWATFTGSELVMTPPEVRNYSVTVYATDNHLSFSRTAFTLRVTDPEGVENIGEESSFTVYPNPAQSVLTITPHTGLEGLYSVKLTNLLGETLFNSQFTGECVIDLSGFPVSVMHLVITANGRCEYHTIVKE